MWKTMPDGSRSPFDIHEVSSGADRYVDTDEGLKPVAEGVSVSALQLHERSCSLNR